MNIYKFWTLKSHVCSICCCKHFNVFYLFFRIMDKHLKSLAPRHVDTKFVRLDAEVSFYILIYGWGCFLSNRSSY